MEKENLIRSAQNKHFKQLKSLLNSRGLRKTGQALVSGRKILPEILRRKNIDRLQIINSLSEEVDEEYQSLLRTTGIDESELSHTVLSKELFNILDVLGTNYPMLVVKTEEIPQFVSAKTGLNVFLALSDPANLGSALRSLAAFSCKQVILLEECCHPFLPKVTKAAAGYNLTLPLSRGSSISDLTGDDMICLDLTGHPLETFQWPHKSCLILGEEGRGVPQSIRQQASALRINMQSSVESLSAPIALAIAAHHHYIAGSNEIIDKG